METLQPRSGSHSRLPLPQREVWPIEIPHGWVLPGTSVLFDHVVLVSHKTGNSFLLFLLLPQAMFVENAFLLLASSWLFTMVSWDTVGIPAAVFCSFLIG